MSWAWKVKKGLSLLPGMGRGDGAGHGEGLRGWKHSLGGGTVRAEVQAGGTGRLMQTQAGAKAHTHTREAGAVGRCARAGLCVT